VAALLKWCRVEAEGRGKDDDEDPYAALASAPDDPEYLAWLARQREGGAR